jgi:5-methylcytosine-specific restriction endonuclease McrA
VRHRSKKKEAEYSLRRPLVEKLLSEKPGCEACPIFAKYDNRATYRQNRSVDVHEIVRRSQGGSILDEKNLMCVCRDCHRRIGNYPQLAFDLGLAKHNWE